MMILVPPTPWRPGRLEHALGTIFVDEGVSDLSCAFGISHAGASWLSDEMASFSLSHHEGSAFSGYTTPCGKGASLVTRGVMRLSNMTSRSGS